MVRSKKVTEGAFSRGITEILKVYYEYLKLKGEQKGEVIVRVDESAMKSLSGKLVMKIEDTFGTFRILRESVLRVVGEIRKEFEVSNKEMKALVVYLKSSKLERSILQLDETMSLNLDKISLFATTTSFSPPLPLNDPQ